MALSGPIKVLLVDDSPMVRTILERVLSQESDIEVVGGATNPFTAREMIIQTRPNVIILDIEMPRMDGVTFLKKLVAHYPVPVIMCSGVASANSRRALEAIEIGAIDVVAKPSQGGAQAMQRMGADLAGKIRAAAVAMKPPPSIPTSVSRKVPSFESLRLDPSQYFVAIGASTGGTEAIKDLMTQLPADFPPVAIVQHMPEGFTKSFAERLDYYSGMKVNEAVDKQVLQVGHAVVAPGGVQMTIGPTGGAFFRVRLGSDELVNRHCPSVDVLFESVAKLVGRRAVGVILTGMGADGAKGLLNMRNAGADTFGQDEQSCIVYGMPKVAADIGAVACTGTPRDIPQMIVQTLKKARGASPRSSTVTT